MEPEEFHDRIWQILDPVDEEAFEPIAAEGASDEAVRDLEELVGGTLPRWLVGLCQSTNGLLITAREEVWPSGKAFDIAPAWTFWRGLVVLGIEHESLPEWATISQAWHRLQEAGVWDVLPLLRIEGDGECVWGLRIRDGRVTEDLVEVVDDEVTPIEGTFLDLYELQIKELVARQRQMADLLKKQGPKRARTR